MGHLSQGRSIHTGFLLALLTGFSTSVVYANLLDAVPLVHHVTTDGIDVTCRYINFTESGLAPRSSIVGNLESSHTINYHLNIPHGTEEATQGSRAAPTRSVAPQFSNPSVRAVLCPPATIVDGVLTPVATSNEDLQAAINRALVADGNRANDTRLEVQNLQSLDVPLNATVRYNSGGCAAGAETAFLPTGTPTSADLHNQFCTGTALRGLLRGIQGCFMAFENSITAPGVAANDLPTPEEFTNRFTTWHRTGAGQSNVPGGDSMQYCSLLGSVFDRSQQHATMVLQEMFPTPSCNGNQYVNVFNEQFPNFSRVHSANRTNESFNRLMERMFGSFNVERNKSSFSRSLQRYLVSMDTVAQALPCYPQSQPAAQQEPGSVQGRNGNPQNVGGSGRTCDNAWTDSIDGSPNAAFCTQVKQWRTSYYTVCQPWARSQGGARVEFLPRLPRAPQNIILARKWACQCANPRGGSRVLPTAFGGQLPDGETCAAYANPALEGHIPFYGMRQPSAPAAAPAAEPAGAPAD